MVKSKKSPRLMYKDVLVAFHQHGLDGVAKMYASGQLHREVLKRLLSHMTENASPEKELLAWLQGVLQRGRGRDAPALGDTRTYDPTFRGDAVPMLRTPLHHVKVKKGKPISVTFNNNEIIIRGAP